VQLNTTLPPNAVPLLPSQHSTEIDLYVDSNLDSLAGVDDEIAETLSSHANENSMELQDRPYHNPVLVMDYLRVRNDESLTLHPIVCQAISEDYHDQLLEDLVKVYHGTLSEQKSVESGLKPFPGFPNSVLQGLNKGYDLAYKFPNYSVEVVGHGDYSPFEYPIQLHDIFADLRSEGIVTSLIDTPSAQYEIDHAEELMEEGYEVNGYASVSPSAAPNEILISVQDSAQSNWSRHDVVDSVLDSAQQHDFISEISVTSFPSCNT